MFVFRGLTKRLACAARLLARMVTSTSKINLRMNALVCFMGVCDSQGVKLYDGMLKMYRVYLL